MNLQHLRNFLDARTEPVCAYLYDLAHLRRRAHTLRRNQRAEILLRVNPASVPQQATLRMGGQATQFGIEEAQIPALIELALGLPGVRLKGLRIHSISNNLDAQTHLALLEHYFDLAHTWQQRYQLEYDWLNAAGAIGIKNPD